MDYQPFAQAYIVEGIIPAGPSFGLIPGPPKSLKSFLLADLLMHIAIGKPYAGRQVQEGAGIYVTSEGLAGVNRRLVAMRRYHEVEGKKVPFALIPVMPNLGTGIEDRDRLKADIDKAVAIAGIKAPVRAIVIDTLRRATPGKSENDPKDMSIFLANVDALAQAFTCFVGVAHHSPRSDESRGSGTNAIDGACDVILPVTRADVGGTPRATVTIGRMKDGDEGASWTFEVRSVEVGVDRSGNPKFGGYVVIVDQTNESAERREQKGKKPPKGAPIALRALIKAVDELGQIPPASNHIPANVRTVSIEKWRQYAYAGGISAGEDRAQQKAFRTAMTHLVDDQAVGCWREQVWLVK
jgi:AAA domain